MERAKRSRNRANVAPALNSLGEIARHREDWTEAADYYDQTLALANELESGFHRAMALHNLGYVAIGTFDHGHARERITESLRLYEGLRHQKGQAECLASLARVEALEGRPGRAAWLCGATDAILKEVHTRLDTLDWADYEGTLATLREELGEQLEPLLSEGQAMSCDDAVVFALKHLEAHRDVLPT